jgi:hypothetical protein
MDCLVQRAFQSIARIPVPDTTVHQKNFDGLSCEIRRWLETFRQLGARTIRLSSGVGNIKAYGTGQCWTPTTKWIRGVRTIREL